VREGIVPANDNETVRRAEVTRVPRRGMPVLALAWIALPGLALVSLLEHENYLIIAHLLTTGHRPAAQFLG
jgi:hypothetical protein